MRILVFYYICDYSNIPRTRFHATDISVVVIYIKKCEEKNKFEKNFKYEKKTKINYYKYINKQYFILFIDFTNLKIIHSLQILIYS